MCFLYLQRKPPPPRESDIFNSSDSINSEEDMLDSEGDDIEVDASKFTKHSNSSPKKSSRKGRQSGSYPDDEDDDGPSEKLLLSMKELKVCDKILLPVYDDFLEKVCGSMCHLRVL